MTRLKLFSAAILACGVSLVANAAQDATKPDDAAMTPPKPVENKVNAQCFKNTLDFKSSIFNC